MKVSPIVKVIRDEMVRRELGVVELAKRADVSFTNLYRILSGDAAPSLDTIEKLAKALKLTVSVQ